MGLLSGLIGDCCSIRPHNASNSWIPAADDDKVLPPPSPPVPSSAGHHLHHNGHHEPTLPLPPPRRNSNGSPSSPVSPEVNRLLKDNVKGILINKASRDMKLGVRLGDRSDGSDEGVEMMDVHEKGPLASVVRKGDILLRLNGKPCNHGWQHASDIMREATGMLELVVVLRQGSPERGGGAGGERRAAGMS